MLIEINGIGILLSRKKIKNMYLRIHTSTGEVTATAPYKMPLSIIQDYLIHKQQWIQKTRARVLQSNRLKPPSIEQGEIHYFLGNPYRLTVHTQAMHMHIDINHQHMNYFMKVGSNSKDNILFLQTWYKQQMQQLLPSLIHKWEPIIRVSVCSFSIRSMKTRWGSCNVESMRITLNLKLIQKPLICIEYVLVHEMVHLHEANHGPRFYALMDKFMPEWREVKLMLETTIF